MQPNHRNALYHLAWCLEKKKEYVEAVGLYTGCLALGVPQGRADVYAHRSACYRKMGRKEAAEADLAAALDPANYDPDHSPAAALNDTGRSEEALAVQRRVLTLRPENADELISLGRILTSLKKYPEAVVAYRKLLELEPDDALAHSYLGVALAELGKFSEAEVACRKAIELEPDEDWAHVYLGLVLANQGKHPEAEAVFRRAIELDPDDAEAKCGLGEVLAKQGKPASATRIYVEAFAADPELAERSFSNRYNAACSAALAGSGQGEDAEKLDDAERSRFRRQALDWLTADLANEAKLANAPADRSKVWKALNHWQMDKDFAHVRGDALAKLPETERIGWQKLWADVEALKKRCEEPPAEAKPPPKP